MSDNLKKLASEVVSRLEDIYPDAPCALEYNGEPWKLLVMARLSAQCTDARVNIVCRELFKKYPTPEALAAGELSDIEKIVYPCGAAKKSGHGRRHDAERGIVGQKCVGRGTVGDGDLLLYRAVGWTAFEPP